MQGMFTNKLPGRANEIFFFFLLLARSIVRGDSERCGLVLLAAAWCSVQMDS